MDRLIGRQAYTIQTGRQTDTEIGGHTHTDKHSHRQMDTHTLKHIHIQTHTHSCTACMHTCITQTKQLTRCLTHVICLASIGIWRRFFFLCPASAAVDALMNSKWSASKRAKEPLFFNRNSCVSFCQRSVCLCLCLLVCLGVCLPLCVCVCLPLSLFFFFFH